MTAILLAPGEDWIAAVAQGNGSSTPGEAAAATTTAKKTTTSTKRATTAKKKTVASRKTSTRRKATTRKSRRAYRPTKGVNARAALLIDAQTGEILFDKNSGTPMPIASLTKLMTAMVFIEADPDLGKRVMVSREDLAGSGHSQLRAGEVLTLRDLLHGSLLSSDNAATRSLVRNSGLESEEFLARMNRKAQVMGLSNTRFVEFTGLSEQNVSSASEYAQILKTASLHPLIAHITTLPDYNYRSSKRDHYLVNTNRLCRYGVFDVKGGKTGYISESGYCLATWVSTRTRDVIAVVLGAPSSTTRFAETRKLIDRMAVPQATVTRGI